MVSTLWHKVISVTEYYVTSIVLLTRTWTAARPQGLNSQFLFPWPSVEDQGSGVLKKLLDELLGRGGSYVLRTYSSGV